MRKINISLNEKNVYVKILMKTQPSEILRILVFTWHDCKVTDSPGKYRSVQNKLCNVSLRSLGSSHSSMAELPWLWVTRVPSVSIEMILFCTFCTFLLHRDCAETPKAHCGAT